MKAKNTNPHETFCLANAAYFTAVRGGLRGAEKIKHTCKDMAEADEFAGRYKDGRTMIYAVTADGHSAHIKNA